METPKKPTPKPATKATKKPAAAYKPVAEATPRYAPPPVAAAPKPAVTASTPDESLELSARFWWAQTWRSIVIIVPVNLVLQFFLLATIGTADNANDSLGLLFIASILIVNVLVQVAVLRYMLRKKHFKGFTFNLTRR
jgi:hypothetical protein